MRKNFSIILFIIISLAILSKQGVCFALEEPENRSVEAVTSFYAKLIWSWDGPEDPEEDGNINHFEIIYRLVKEPPEDPEDWELILIDKGARSDIIIGLLDERPYEWQIRAVADETKHNSDFVYGEGFTTTIDTTEAPPELNGGGFLQDIPLSNPLGKDTLWEAIDAVLNFFILAAFAIAPILIIYSAFLMIFAAGDATKISRAKEIIFWTVIALAVILFAKGLPSVIKGAFSG